jgi:broad specificity phosphatase PhoE
MQTRLRLISHAATAAMRSGTFPSADDPLDARGLAGIAAWRERPTLTGDATTKVFCSPALCARNTADALGFQAEVAAALADADYGQWRGRRLSEIATETPEALAAWTRDPDAAPPEGESFRAVLTRTGAWLDAFATAGNAHHGDVIAVTHALVIRAAIIHTLAASPAMFTRIDIAPLSVVELRLSAGGGWTWWPGEPRQGP